MVRAEFVFAVLLCVASITNCCSAQPLFQEEDGVVVMEVESAPPSGMWKPERDMKGYSGKGYYTWRGPDRFNKPGSGVLAYRFLVTQEGEYRLAIRNRHDFRDSTEHNDCFTSMDGGRWIKMFSSRRGEWTWRSNHELSHNDKPRASYRLTAGMHVLRLCGRSTDFSIDCIHLYREGSPGAEDESREETKGIPAVPSFERVDPVLSAWRTGRLGDALEAAESLSESQDAETAQEARRCVETLSGHARQQRTACEQLREQDPVMAAEMLAVLANRYQPSSVGKEIAAAASKLASDPAVLRERKAREVYQAIQKVAVPLLGKGTVKNKKFVLQHRRELNYIAAGWAKMQKTYGETKAYEQARTIAEQLGIRIDE